MPVIVLSVCVMGITLLFALFIPNVCKQARVRRGMPRLCLTLRLGCV